MKKRILSLLLILCMAVTLLPTAVFAEDATGKLIPAGGAKIGETVYQTLEAAVTAAASGDTIVLGEGNYTLYKVNSEGHTKGKDLTFVGQGADKTGWNIGAEVPDPANFGTEYNGDYSFDGAGTVTFKNMTLRSGKADYLGFIRADKTVVEDCIINGKTFYWGYTSAEFKNTTFNCPSGNYAIWTYSSPTMTFDTCTFNSSGKVINVYTDYGAGKQDITVNFKNCTVNSTAPESLSVMNINDGNMGGFKYILNFSGSNTVNGIKADGIKSTAGSHASPAKDTGTKTSEQATCSKLFEFNMKYGNGNTGKTIVNIDGKPVWKDGKMVSHAIDTANDKYTDGYKDNAFTITYSEWTKNPDGTKTHTVTKTCNYCGYQESTTETAEADPIDWDVSKSKIATKLDTNTWTSNVTLSLPSAEEELVSDVVFVLDQSDCKDTVLADMRILLEKLNDDLTYTNASVNVGVVFFRGCAVTAYPLSKYTGVSDPIFEAIAKANSEMKLKGTNLPAGLLEAQKMLSQSSTSPARQYMILVSDGATYLYTHDNDPATHFSRTSGYYSMDGGLYEWQAKYDPDIYGKNSIPYALPKDFSHNGNATDWENFLSGIAASRDTFTKFDQEYVRTDEKPEARLTKPDPICTADTVKDFIINVEESMYQATSTYKQIVASGVNCYAISTSTDMGVFTSFSKYLADLGKGSGMNFSSIKNDILYAVGAGSTVEDKIGDAFDFVPGSLKLTVGGTELESKAEGNVTYFGDRAENLNEENFRFKVQYAPDTETFVWTINENVSNFAPVQLTYTVKLTNPETAPGTYGVEDLNGEKTLSEAEAEKALFTNAYAVLNAKNSAGAPVKAQEFPKPSVSYTVKSFIDASGSPAIIAAACLNTKDHYSYLIGYSDGTVRPNGRITRAEVATIFFRLLTDDARQRNWSSENNFSDVSADKWYNNAVSTLCHMGVLGGYSDGTFRPNAPITRAEFAKIAVSFSQANGSAVYSYFTDVKTTDWFAPYVTTAKDSGLIEGYSDGSFKPENRITRAEACAIVNRVLGRKPSKSHMKISGRIDWPDCTTADWFYEAIMEATNSHTYQMGKRVETWNGKLPQRDWAALENNWASAYTGKGGEVH